MDSPWYSPRIPGHLAQGIPVAATWQSEVGPKLNTASMTQQQGRKPHTPALSPLPRLVRWLTQPSITHERGDLGETTQLL